ncbi:hypothetical protein Bbelb_377780 [Branchiostoma belcheri]|nr:hypothetical protein Bbelb_377780 [Branchiostoma belcheri]
MTGTSVFPQNTKVLLQYHVGVSQASIVSRQTPCLVQDVFLLYRNLTTGIMSGGQQQSQTGDTGGATPEQQDQTNWRSLAHAAATIPNALYVSRADYMDRADNKLKKCIHLCKKFLKVTGLFFAMVSILLFPLFAGSEPAITMLPSPPAKTVPGLSQYAASLENHVKKRYVEKISVIDIDPVTVPSDQFDTQCLPPVEQSDLFSYLVLETSHYTNDQFKNYKSLEAYNHVVSGFVAAVKGKIIAGKYVVVAKKTAQEKQGEKTSHEKQGEKTSHEKQGEKTSQEKQGEKTSQEKQGGKTPQDKQGEKTPQDKQGEKTSQEKQGDKTAQEKQGEKTSQEKQGEKTPQDKQGEKTSHEKQRRHHRRNKERRHHMRNKEGRHHMRNKERRQHRRNKGRRHHRKNKERRHHRTNKERRHHMRNREDTTGETRREDIT